MSSSILPVLAEDTRDGWRRVGGSSPRGPGRKIVSGAVCAAGWPLFVSVGGGLSGGGGRGRGASRERRQRARKAPKEECRVPSQGWSRSVKHLENLPAVYLAQQSSSRVNAVFLPWIGHRPPLTPPSAFPVTTESAPPLPWRHALRVGRAHTLWS